ncbi:hypothetical protein BJY01DRAFT_251439 [Aspergillus pseudoustus]|uniref:Secreted RxLR effector peptide protein n=1 Tax=Aspergillus pseudoustus TaxID=1810923 RepID=A0ABR4JBU8_9EURO
MRSTLSSAIAAVIILVTLSAATPLALNKDSITDLTSNDALAKRIYLIPWSAREGEAEEGGSIDDESLDKRIFPTPWGAREDEAEEEGFNENGSLGARIFPTLSTERDDKAGEAPSDGESLGKRIIPSPWWFPRA